MRAILLGAFVFAFATSAALADEDVMASRYGNTTDSVDSAGVHTKLYYSADHTFKADVAGTMVNGTWQVAAGTVCLTYVNPPANMPPTLPNPTCLPVQARKVGETWTTGSGAMQRTVTIEAGIH